MSDEREALVMVASVFFVAFGCFAGSAWLRSGRRGEARRERLRRGRWPAWTRREVARRTRLRGKD